MNEHLASALKTLAVVAAAVTTLGVSATASAQSAGDFSLQLGLKKITPIVDSGTLTAPTQPGVKTGAGNDTQPVITIDYMVTDHIGLETFIAPPFKHDQIGEGSLLGVGKLGTVESLPATVFVQYRFFAPNAKVRPYVGVGITYAYFRKETGSAQLSALSNTGGAPTTFSVESTWGYGFQLGVSVALNDHWFLNSDVTKSYVNPVTRFSTGQTIQAKLDPISASISLGYHF
jgi:outer membrane protein